jgi:hypothetical protein
LIATPQAFAPFRLLACVAIFFGLCACERETYTSWSCNSQTETKIPMVLRKAQMELQGNTFDYCGSLGNQSYFDQKCSAETNQSSITFTPSTGLLVNKGQELQCAAL